MIDMRVADDNAVERALQIRAPGEGIIQVADQVVYVPVVSGIFAAGVNQDSDGFKFPENGFCLSDVNVVNGNLGLRNVGEEYE